MATTDVRPAASPVTTPPGPKSRIPLMQFMELRRDTLGFFLQLAQYGDIAYFEVGPQPIYFLNHPDYIRDVLVTNQRNFVKGRGLERAKKLLGEGLLTSEGEFHLRQRRLSQPAFHRQRVNAYAGAMTDYAGRTDQRWQQLGKGATVDMHHEMMRLTLGIVGKTLFDTDVESEADEIGEAITSLIELFTSFSSPLAELLEKIPFLPRVQQFNRARDRLDATIYRVINERRKDGHDRGDLLSMLLMAQDTEGDGSSMTDLQLRDEALTLFLAGHETTANALTWTWFLLSQNPDAEAKFHAEIDSVLAGRLPTADDVARLPYTRMVLSESMRLYPPAYIIGRRAINEYEVGGYHLPARSIVLMSQYVMQHDPRYFPNPYRFEPERWTAEATAARPKFSYFPFGGGSRICIGEAFAWMEGILLLATLGQKWKMRHVPGHPVELQAQVTLRPKHGMQMILQPR